MNQKKKKLNFAVLMNMNFYVRYSKHKIWSGILQAAKDFDLNLFCIDGKSLNNDFEHIAEQNLIYDLIDPHEFDGIIVWTFTLATYVKKHELESFFDKFKSVPLVIGESCYNDIPSVHIDYQQMMDLAVGHLVKQHNLKKIALVQGPENLDYTQMINKAYKKALFNYNIPYDPKLVSEPCHRWLCGHLKLLEMMEKRNLRFKDDIEAIISPRDALTQRIYEAIRNNGNQIPYDVSMIGFASNSNLKRSMPEATMISPPFYQMGYEAIKMLRDICLGHPVEKFKKFPVKLVINQSCGCQVHLAGKVEPLIKPDVQYESFNNTEALKEKFLLTMESVINQLPDKSKSVFNFSIYISQLIEAYINEFYHNSEGVFYKTLDTIMDKVIKISDSIDEWQFICTEFRNYSLHFMLSGENINEKLAQMEKLWPKIFLLISESKLKARKLRDDRLVDLNEKYRVFNRNFKDTVDLDDLISRLANVLPNNLGIKNGYLVLFDHQDIFFNLNNNVLSYSLILFSQNRECRREKHNTAENRSLFVPAEFNTDNQAYSFIIKPLFYQKKKIGFLALSTEIDYINVYEWIKRELSSILYRLELFKNIKEKTSEIARQKKLLDIFFISAPGRICLRNNSNKIIRVNKAYANWYGFTNEDDLIGISYLDLLDEKTAENIYKRDKDILLTGQPVLDMEENLGNSWALTTIMPLYDEQNKILGIMEIARDITDLKKNQEELIEYRNHLEELVRIRTKALEDTNFSLYEEINERIRIETALRKSDRQYRMLAETVQDGIMIIQQNKVIFANQVLQEMMDYTQDELKKKDIVSLLNLDKVKDIGILPDNTQQDTQKVRKFKPLQREIILKYGKKLWFDIDRKPIVWNSDPALLLTMHNITDRVKIEEELENERVKLENERAKLEQENINLKSSIKERYRFGEIIGKSPAMQRVYELIVNAASAIVNVLIIGESGTGKELIARTIHRLSPRNNNAFIPVNCASIPDTLFEREFFGHVKGAFTGADQTKPGFFDQANNGFLFLDEVTELSTANQAKLLRVLQDGEYIALGSTKPKKADVLIIEKKKKNVSKEIKAGRIRKDFFYRIGVIDINLPPLRERKEDLPLLIEHILNNYRKRLESIQKNKTELFPEDFSMFPGKLVQEIYHYNWPGNIRELQNIVQKFLATGNQNILHSIISANIESEIDSDENINLEDKSLSDILKRIEKKYINNSLQKNHFNVPKTAKTLKMSLRTLNRRLEEYGLIEKEEDSK